MGSQYERVAAVGTLGELMEAEWLLLEVARLHDAPTRRRAFRDWLPQQEQHVRYAVAA